MSCKAGAGGEVTGEEGSHTTSHAMLPLLLPLPKRNAQPRPPPGMVCVCGVCKGVCTRAARGWG